MTVLGDGRLGLLVAQVLRDAGCPVRVIGKHPEKLALCEKWRSAPAPLADIVPRHDQDIVVDCTGSAAGLEMALQMVRPRGTIVLKSTVADGQAAEPRPRGDRRNQHPRQPLRPVPRSHPRLAEKRIDVASLIHRRMKLEQGVEAMELRGAAGGVESAVDGWQRFLGDTIRKMRSLGVGTTTPCFRPKTHAHCAIQCQIVPLF